MIHGRDGFDEALAGFVLCMMEVELFPPSLIAITTAERAPVQSEIPQAFLDPP